MKTAFARAHQLLSTLLLLGVVGQFFTLGLGIFAGVDYEAHNVLGVALIVVALSLLALALIDGMGWMLTALSALLAALTLIQPLLLRAGEITGLIAALHPVSAVAIALIAFVAATEPHTLKIPVQAEQSGRATSEYARAIRSTDTQGRPAYKVVFEPNSPQTPRKLTTAEWLRYVEGADV